MDDVSTLKYFILAISIRTWPADRPLQFIVNRLFVLAVISAENVCLVAAVADVLVVVV